MNPQTLTHKDFMAQSRNGLDISVLQSTEVAPLFKGHYCYVNTGHFGFIWYTLALFVVSHALYAMACYWVANQIMFGGTVKMYYSFCWLFFILFWEGIGISVGAHRLWSHRSFKAKLPLRIFLMLGHVLSGQLSIYAWAANHKLHHKYSDTDSDPHNARRSIWFAHIGWMMKPDHPERQRTRAKYDFSYLLEDSVVRFNLEHEYALLVLLSGGLMILVPVVFWQESLIQSFLISVVLRIFYTMHVVSFINSAAHTFGDRPYNSKILPGNNGLSFTLASFGEGQHNYHHTFPNDYRQGDATDVFNIGKRFIDLMAICGQAYDLKSMAPKLIEARKERDRVKKQHDLIYYKM